MKALETGTWKYCTEVVASLYQATCMLDDKDVEEGAKFLGGRAGNRDMPRELKEKEKKKWR
jgi:hypothetical protein